MEEQKKKALLGIAIEGGYQIICVLLVCMGAFAGEAVLWHRTLMVALLVGLTFSVGKWIGWRVTKDKL